MAKEIGCQKNHDDRLLKLSRQRVVGILRQQVLEIAKAIDCQNCQGNRSEIA